LGLRLQAAKVHPQLLRREKIAKELYETEKSYVQLLNVLIKVFLQPILDSVVKSDKNQILTADETKALFSIIEIIAKINAEFLSNLETRVNSWNPYKTKIGDLLSNFTENQKVYQRYVNNYDNTMTVYLQCLKNRPKFVELLNKAKEIPETKYLDLLSFLIMPIQRIPRYILLLGDLVKNTPPEHEDYKETELALQKIKGMAELLNEGKRKAENAIKVANIQDSLVGLEEELVKEGRYFIREGSLIKKKKKSSDYCYFFLLSDLLLHCVENKKKYKVKHTVPLSNVTIIDIPDTEFLKNAFKITWYKDHSWMVSANSSIERKGWVDDLKKAIGEIKK